MLTINNLAVLVLAGTTLAAPALQERDLGGWRLSGWKNDSAAPTSTVWSIATATIIMTGTAPTSTHIPPEDAPETTAAAAATTPAAIPAPSAASSGRAAAPSSAPSTGTYMDTVSKWRSAGGLPALTEDSTLQGNALKTATDGNGQMVHELNPGSMAQVLAPGNADNFESVYVGGWLCEVPSLPGLNGICTTMAQGWDHSNGETGHADILTSTSYTKIGCALADGIWACDLA